MSGVSSGEHLDPDIDTAREFFKHWEKLNSDVSRGSNTKAGDDCTASVHQSYLQFLLGDLIIYHEVTGIQAYGFPRRHFYMKELKELHEVGDRDADGKRLHQPEVVFCEYRFDLVCIANKCVSCDALPADVDPKLKTACGCRGEGGLEAEQVEWKEGQMELPETLERKDCDSGWLTVEDMRKWHTMITEEKDYEGNGHWGSCMFNFDLQRGWYVLDFVVRGLTREGELEAEVKDNRDFYEERLWMFRDGKNTDKKFCLHTEDKNKDGPWACSADAGCVECKYVLNETYSMPTGPYPEILIGCMFEGRPEKYEKTCKV